MAEAKTSTPKWKSKKHMAKSGASPGPVYGLGFIGALIYYIDSSTSFGTAVVGVLKALVWPAFLVNHLLSFLHL